MVKKLLLAAAALITAAGIAWAATVTSDGSVTTPVVLYSFGGVAQGYAAGGSLNTTTGVSRVAMEEGWTTTLNMTAATQVRTGGGRAYKISVITAGAVGQLCDTTTACAAANVVMTVPAAVGVYEINWPFATGIRYEPGAAQVSSIVWQ